MSKGMLNLDEFDKQTFMTLLGQGLNPTTTVPIQGQRPYTMMGVPNAQVREVPGLANTNVNGFISASNRHADERANRGATPVVFVKPGAEPSTIAHETEHLLARQNAGFAQMPRNKFMDILKEKAPMSFFTKQSEFLKGLKESLPYLKEKYGIDNGYMDPEFIDSQGAVGLYEIFATLAAAESTQNVDLTKDPELRKKMFSSPEVRQAYNAVTGLRQTRMDSKDLPPYTAIDEPSWWENVFKNPFK